MVNLTKEAYFVFHIFTYMFQGILKIFFIVFCEDGGGYPHFTGNGKFRGVKLNMCSSISFLGLFSFAAKYTEFSPHKEV